MSRLPIRIRLTAAFTLAMALVLTAIGLFLYRHLETSLDRTLAQGLHARAADVALLVQQSDAGLRESPATSVPIAQVLAPAGRVFDHTPGAPRPLLTATQLGQARHGPLLVPRAHGDRLYAIPVRAQDRRLVVVVGAPLSTRDEALAALRTELLVGAPVALLLAALLGYIVAAAALKPVERMRVRAGEISTRRLSGRLPVPPARDEVARLGETLNAMLARLEDGVARERSFVADASHELRTPLAHLKVEVELALDGPRDCAELTAALRSVGTEADRLTQLAEDLLLLARADDGTLPIRREEVVVRELLETVARRFGRRAHEAGRTIDVHANGECATIDRLRMEQALTNLVDNALRYGRGTIRLSGDAHTLRVSDEGAGFPPGFAPHAFERFSRADDSRSAGGAGLGLAIVAAVAEAHGGSTSVDGAEITLRLLPSARARAS
jgi:two-component system, OmpR family, sensor kinase